MARWLIGSVMLAAVFVITGMKCQAANPSGSVTPVKSAQLFSREILKVDVPPYEEGVLIMAGTAYDVKIVPRKGLTRGDFVFLINAAGTTIEEERYHIDDTVLQYRGSLTETFNPPLTLATFPVKTGSSDTWNGTLDWGPTKLNAKADITIEADPLNMQSGKVDDAVLILAKLTITEEGGNTTNREFKFWVAPERGIVRRDFASVSSREPASTPPAAE